ncbi:hypothetical protein TWF481_007519 [Arthrobotrys musiformis]|uniref:Uncharacterized protein n=1 Tax=Arthrobotrys musiformis TaxID=47236 RepID=A0AAV9WBP5_9PEZI
MTFAAFCYAAVLLSLPLPMQFTAAAPQELSLRRSTIAPRGTGEPFEMLTGQIFNGDIFPVQSRQCRIGLYHRTEINWYDFVQEEMRVQWEGFGARGRNSFSENEDRASVEADQNNIDCHNISEFYDAFDYARITGIRVLGYCYCRFWYEKDCKDGANIGVIRGQVPLDAYGDGKLLSIGCTKTTGWDLVLGCSLWLSNGASRDEKYKTIDGDDNDGYYSVRLNEGDIDQWTGNSLCYLVAEGKGTIMRDWKIDSCTCSFYTDEHCESSALIVDGNSGSVERQGWEGSGGQKIRSVRCHPPYGPPYPEVQGLIAVDEG